MKKYKNYIFGAVILILGIIIGNISSGDSKSDAHNDDEHNLVQDPITQLWTCSMHPQIQLEKPGSCPICGMDLIPLEKNNTSGESIADNEIVMTAEAIQLANIQTSIVTKTDAKKEVRLLGTVKPDERRQYSQVSHIPGRIERLYVNFTGEKVRRGQKMIRIYSPELISAQKELFEAIKSKEIYPQLYKASRNKLKLWKLTDAQIDAIVNSGKVQEQIDILSDYSGYVMKRNIELGDHVMVGMNIYDIANIDTIWVMFEAYETDIPWIHNGDVVNFTLQAIPGKTYKGKITYIDPFVSAKTRVAKVRVEIKNPGHKLLPEMYANGIITANLKGATDALVIPKSAVLWTGKRAVIYVKVPHDNTISFVYREVVLGADLGDFYIVEKGLEEGEEIATNGVFRIDASAQLLGQKSMMNPEGNSKKQKRNTNSKKTNPEFQKQLGNVVDKYIPLKNALVDGDSSLAKRMSENIKTALKEVDMSLLSGDAHAIWMKKLNVINKEITIIEKSNELETQRKAFGLLSKSLSESIEILGVISTNNKEVYLEFCPMADDNNGSFWLSYDKEIYNPYFGESMMSCGEVKKTY